MKLIKILFLISLYFTLSFSKGEVSKIFAHKEIATSTHYTAIGKEYHWGQGKNLVVDGFEYEGNRYKYVSDVPIVKIRRADNLNALGEACGLFAEKSNGNDYHLEATFPNTDGNCDMAKVMGGRTINVGALDLFRNEGYTAKNIERVDFISPQGITAPIEIANLSKAGHVVTEKQGNNYLQIAAILSIDTDNNPTSFGPLVMIHRHNDDSTQIRYALSQIYLPDNSFITHQDLGFYIDNTSGSQGKPWWIETSNESLGMAFVTLQDLGINTNQKYYGFSYFGRDVNSQNSTLTDITTFPKDTSGDTADPYGGVASYFMKEDIYDFGDAPDAYPHVSHEISSNLYLGDTAPDAEDDQQSTIDATGDGADDNDGAIDVPILNVNDTSYTVPFKVFNNTGQDAYITAWIDFDRNNVFEFNEALNVNDLSVSSFSTVQTVNVIWDNNFSSDQFNDLTAGKAIMRIRLTTSRVLRRDSEHNSTGGNYADNYFVSPNGEIEDYEITIESEPPVDSNGTCWAIDDENKILYTFDMSTLAAPTQTAIDTKNVGEGLTYRPSTNELYMWDEDNTIVRNTDTGARIRSYATTYADEVEGASFYINPITQEEELWVIVEDYTGPGADDYKDRYIQRVDINTGVVIPSTRKKVVGGFMDPLRTTEYGNDIGSLAINPKTKKFLISHDADNRKLANINPLTGQLSNVRGISPLNIVDAEAMSFDASGIMYTESDMSGESKRYLWRINPINGQLTKASAQFGIGDDGDLEGLACNAGSSDVNTSHTLTGQFNIERTNSGLDTIGTDERNAWYTQIVGRDFDYSVLFYNDVFNAEKNISNVTMKIELINQDTNVTLYERYAYIPKIAPTSRVNVTIPTEDLSSLPATRKAIFRVSYGVDANNSIIQTDCTGDFKTCYEQNVKIKTDYARDNFAIRPDNFFLKILDTVKELNTSQDAPNQNTLAKVRLAAGYKNYNLIATATKYMSPSAAKGYTKNFFKQYDLNTTGNCASRKPLDYTFSFTNGSHSSTFMHDNVGKYIVDLYDNNWTIVDQNISHLDCIKNSTSRIRNIDGRVGCDIGVYLNGIEVNFHPHHFLVDVNMQNLPDSGHPDFIYMTNINKTFNDVAIQFSGDITAQTEDNKTTTNFTTGCVATEMLLNLNASTVSVEGSNKQVTTIKGKDVDFSRIIRFNDDANPSNLQFNNSITIIGSTISIAANKFLDVNQGTMRLDMRYNLNKHLSEPINPVEVTFNSMDVNATAAYSSAYQIDNHTPSGSKIFANNVKNFYFAKVVSKLNEYPRVYINRNPLVLTPLYVDIYCGTTTPNYCRDRKIFDNANTSGTVRDQNGWYISSKHHGELDGNVTALTPNHTGVISISPNPTEDIPLASGQNNRVNKTFNNCNTESITISISTDPALVFEPSKYIVSCTDNNGSNWAGIGKAGNTLDIAPNVNKNEKMNW